MGAFQILLPDFFQHPHSVAMTTAFVSTSIPGQQRRWWMFNDTLYRTRALTHTRTRKLLTFATELSLRLFDKNVKKKNEKNTNFEFCEPHFAYVTNLIIT